MRRNILLGLVIAVGQFVSCSGAGTDACIDDPVSPRSELPQVASDWRAALDSVTAAAPADSSLDIVVFVAATERAGFREWTEARRVPITYEFHFSAFRVSPMVRDLASLKEVGGVTGIDWGVGVLAPLCY